jgi:hypothetical protein
MQRKANNVLFTDDMLRGDSQGTPLMKPLLKQAWAIGRGLTVLLVVNMAVLIYSTVARFADNTVLNGISLWDKPIKFAISFIAFAPAVLWLFSRFERSRWIRVGIAILGWSMVVEIAVIFAQSVRGTTSHFNTATVLDGGLYNVMAAGVGIFATAGLVTGLILARRNLGTGPLAIATKFAIPMMTLGGTMGFAMTNPKPGQVEAGGLVTGGHNVGGVDSSDGIAFLGWSTKVGDLRVPHFLGLHSLHVVPAIALLVVWLVRRGSLQLSERRQRLVTASGAVAWSGVVVTAFVQAMRGIAVTAPDAMTWASLGVLAGIPAVFAIALAVKAEPL